MKYIAIAFLFLSLFGQKSELFAQSEVSKYRNILDDGNIKKSYWQVKDNKNELQIAFSGLFLFYKTFLSSQDLTVCTFTPSCSEYGILAIKHRGLIKGGLMTVDRLTRCNGLTPQKYEFDPKTMLLKDDPTIDHFIPVVSTLK